MKKTNSNQGTKMSIIVPVYNTEQYLEKCLDSLINQTLKEIEVIIVNDGSPDNSQKIIDEYKFKYPNIIKSFAKPNGGLSDARNFGLNEVNGEYLTFLDSDDYMEFDAYEKMYDKAKDTNADVVAIPFAYVYKSKIVKNFFYDDEIFGKSILEEPKILKSVSSPACNKIYKTDFWKSNNFQFPVGYYFEDSALIYNVLLCANKIECVNYPMYYYLKAREGAITKESSKRLYDVFNSCDSIVNFYKDKKVFDELEKYIQNTCIRHIFARVYQLGGCKSKKMVRDFINSAFEYLDNNFPNWKKDEFFDSKKMKSKRAKFKRNISKNKFWLKIFYYIPKPLKRLTKKFLRIPKNIKKALRKTDDIFNLTEQEIQSRTRNVQNNGYITIEKITKVLDKLGLTNFVDFGTLLGFVREKKFLSNDLDIDIGVINAFDDSSRIIRAMEEEGVKLWRQYYYKGKVVEESYKIDGIKIDLNYYELDDDKMKTWLFFRKPNINYGNERHVVEMNYVKNIDIKKIKLNGYEINIPSKAEQLLEEKYGKSWRIPDTGWIYWQSPAATEVEGFGYSITYRYVHFPQSESQIESELKRIRKLQLIELEILHELDRVCKKINVNYYLGEGTLLGAIRHNGFIPWDDDIDVLMLRDDYEKFLEFAPKEIKSDFEVQHSRYIENYWSPFIKIRYLKDSGFKQSHIEHLTKNNGPLLDIFPIDSVPKKDSLKQRIQAIKAKLYRGMVSYKLKSRIPKKYKGKIVRFLAKFYSIKGLHKKINKNLTRYNNKDNKYFVNLCSYYSYKKQTVPKEWYGEPRNVNFEGIKSSVPKEAEKLLKSIYGDYMKLPPKNERQIKHHFHD